MRFPLPCFNADFNTVASRHQILVLFPIIAYPTLSNQCSMSMWPEGPGLPCEDAGKDVGTRFCREAVIVHGKL